MFTITWHYPPEVEKEAEERIENAFLCPACTHVIQVQNVCCITCPNCGWAGSRRHFAPAERKAA
jgi:transcription elongation factor Elf1